MDKFLLKGLLYLARTWLKKDVDFGRLQVIAETKLLMDRRRTRVNHNNRKQKESKNPLRATLLFYALFGLMMGILIFFTANSLLSMILIHAYLLFMMSMTLITDFSSVLLDTTDNQVILPKPVNGRTLFVARLIHILVYLLQFTIALGIFPLIAIFVVMGIAAGFAAIFTILLTVALAVFFTYFLYILILSISNEQKAKDIIGYFQIFMTVLFTAGYQLVPRLIDYEALNRTFALHWYSYFLPPVWMAVTIESFQHLVFDGTHLTMILCSIAIPVFTFWLMIRYLAPSFSRKLASLQNDSEANKKKRKITKASSFSAFFSNIICKVPSEKAGYELVWKVTGRDRGFKMQFYPGIGYILVFAFIIIFKSGKDINGTMQSLPGSSLFLWFIYLPMFMVSGSVRIINSSEHFMASWVYFSMPIKYPGQILSGALKALFTKFFLPAYLLMYIAAFYFWGIAITDDFLFGLFNNLVIFTCMELFATHYLPFSRQQNIKDQTGRFVKVILQFAIIAALVGLHYLALQVNYLVAILIPVAATGSVLLFKKIQSLRWRDMTI